MRPTQKMVGVSGIEPLTPKRADLQSVELTTLLNTPMILLQESD